MSDGHQAKNNPTITYLSVVKWTKKIEKLQKQVWLSIQIKNIILLVCWPQSHFSCFTLNTIDCIPKRNMKLCKMLDQLFPQLKFNLSIRKNCVAIILPLRCIYNVVADVDASAGKFVFSGGCRLYQMPQAKYIVVLPDKRI